MTDKPGPDRKALIAILLCAVIWATWMHYTSLKQQEAKLRAKAMMTPTPAATALVTGTSGVMAATTGTSAQIALVPEVRKRLENKVLHVELSSVGARPVEADLNAEQYRPAKELDHGPFWGLVSASVKSIGAPIAPLAPWFGDEDRSRIPSDARFEKVAESDTSVTFRYTAPDGLRLTRTYTTSADAYLVDLVEVWENSGSTSIEGRPGLVWATNLKPGIKSGWFGAGEADYNCSAAYGNTVVHKTPKAPHKEPWHEENVKVHWVGVADRYFLAAVAPAEPKWDAAKGRSIQLWRPAGKSIAALGLGPDVKLEPGAKQTFAHKLYLGPKDYKILKASGFEFDRAIAWGTMIAPISRGIWYLLHFFYGWASNWGVAIILLTIVIRGALSPLAARQMRMANEFAAKSAKIKPQMDRLREKHKDDPMTLNQETWKLYQQHGLSPMTQLSGCLPILLQMPIWFALYKVLWTSIDLRGAPFALWLQDLSAPDPIYVLPVLLGAVTFLQMKLTPMTGMDPAQAKMMLYMMPLMFTLPMISLPSGLVLYIFTSTVINIAQQWFLRRKYPPGPPPVPVAPITAQGQGAKT